MRLRTTPSRVVISAGSAARWGTSLPERELREHAMSDPGSSVHCCTLVVRRFGRFVHLGHRDAARSLMRALRRSGLPLRMTEGFHPHVKMSLPEPLPLGVGSDGERYVVYFTREVSAAEVRSRLAVGLPEGCELRAVLPGAAREPLDLELTLEIRLQGGPAEFAALDPAALGLAALHLEAEGSHLRAKLCPAPGRRVSVGRFLRALETAGARIVEVIRRIESDGSQDCVGRQPS